MQFHLAPQERSMYEVKDIDNRAQDKMAHMDYHHSDE